MEMTDLLKFEIRENSIQTPSGQFYAFRISPPNFSTMDENEQERFHRNYEGFMAATKDIRFAITSLDKALDTTKNREYIEGLQNEFNAYKEDILAAMNTVQSASGNAVRAHYFIIRPSDAAQVEAFQGMLTGTGINFKLADKSELISLLRSFLLREFTDKPLYTYQEEVQE